MKLIKPKFLLYYRYESTLDHNYRKLSKRVNFTFSKYFESLLKIHLLSLLQVEVDYIVTIYIPP